MQILTAKQTQEVDKYTIENEPIASIDLMERAAAAFTDAFFELVSPKKKVAIVCGRGNNGGDGLAIGRMLLKRQYEVDIYVVQKEKDASDDFRVNEKRLQSIHNIASEDDIPDFASYDVLIDGLFGSGLSRPVEGLYAEIINSMNGAGCEIIAIDIPSGLFADQVSAEGAIVKAQHTISFQMPKLGFLLPENAEYVGEWQAVNIGLSQEGIDKQSTSYHYITTGLAKSLLKTRSKYDHKGTNGHALLMAGSFGKMGAAVLSGRGALRSGLGLLTMYIPGCGYDIIQSGLPEAMALVDEGDHFLTTCPRLDNFDVVGIGPGIGKEQETMMSLIEMVRAIDKPIILDADAINLMAEHHEILEMLPKGSILTPHPKEFERLIGEWDDGFHRLEKQKELASKYGLVVIVKGAHTAVALPNGDVYFNSSGNPGMATGGSGDVLTGVVTSLKAQGYNSEVAAIIAVYIHGLAGDYAAESVGQISLNASDIVDYLPQAFQSLG